MRHRLLSLCTNLALVCKQVIQHLHTTFFFSVPHLLCIAHSETVCTFCALIRLSGLRDPSRLVCSTVFTQHSADSLYYFLSQSSASLPHSHIRLFSQLCLCNTVTDTRKRKRENMVRGSYVVSCTCMC